MLHSLWLDLGILWPSIAAVVLLAVILGLRQLPARVAWIVALAIWIATVAAYELRIGQDSSEPLFSAASHIIAGWLLVTAAPIVAVMATFTLQRDRDAVARAAVAGLVGLVAVLPIPMIMMAVWTR